MVEELNSYFNLLKDVSSPVYLILLFTFFLGLIVYQIFKNVIAPTKRQHQQEKDALLSLFARLDPDPLIRFSRTGEVVIANDSAVHLFKSSFNSVNIQNLLQSIKISPAEMIDKEISLTFSENINQRDFLITVKPIPSLGVGQLYFKDITDNLKYERQLLEYQQRLKEYSQSLEKYIEEEKFRIARDLHDSIGQKLLLLKMKAQKCLEPLGKQEQEMNLSLEETINELREIIYNLKPKILEELGLPAALNVLTQKISSESGISGKFELTGKNERFSCKIELFLFRIAQEALSNVVKHSGADVFNIQLVNSADSLKLLITDNGRGFDSAGIFRNNAALTGFGLFNIKEKVENICGTFRINSSPDEGTILMIILDKRSIPE